MFLNRLVVDISIDFRNSYPHSCSHSTRCAWQEYRKHLFCIFLKHAIYAPLHMGTLAFHESISDFLEDLIVNQSYEYTKLLPSR